MKNSLIFFGIGAVLGAAIGVVSTYLIVDKKFGDRSEEEISLMKDYYKNKYAPSKEDVDEEEPDTESRKSEVPPHVKEALLKDWNRAPLREIEPDLAENEHPQDSDEDEHDILPSEEDELRANEEAREIDEEYRRNKNKPPRIISVKDIGNFNDAYEEVEWSYYKFDQVLADENDEAIIDPENIIGDCLDKYDFRNNDEETLYVVSYEHMTIVEITKLYLSYADKKANNEQYYSDLKAYGYNEN